MPEPEKTVVYPTVESVEKELAEKEAKHRQEMKHLRALLRVLKDKEA